jgi:L-rhamnonate dehydratase
MDISRIWERMYRGTLYFGRDGVAIQAMAGIDLALWDIKGKALKQPVHQLLGGAFRDSVRVYTSNMFQFTPEATAERPRKRSTKALLRSSLAGSRSARTRKLI